MNNTALQLFCNRIVEAGCLTQDDARTLSREILPDGLLGREQADLLLALDRAVADTHDDFAGFLVAEVVNFAVFGERPTGTITREGAVWLAASIAGRKGPTPTGSRIALEIVREAQASDEALIAFALEANRWTRQPAGARTASLPLAA